MSISPDLLSEQFRDPSLVSADGESKQKLPHGVTIRNAITHVDGRGSVCEIFDTRWGWSEEPVPFVYTYSLRPGMIKGWGMHKLHEDRYFILLGDMEIVMYDARPESPTYKLVATVVLAEHQRRLVNIPTGIWHANHNIGSKDVFVINLPTQPYNHESPDKYRLPLDTDLIPYQFKNVNGW
jgi:dTDP-4-dehydrorhamnose 3,5-epimerase